MQFKKKVCITQNILNYMSAVDKTGRRLNKSSWRKIRKKLVKVNKALNVGKIVFMIGSYLKLIFNN